MKVAMSCVICRTCFFGLGNSKYDHNHLPQTPMPQGKPGNHALNVVRARQQRRRQ